MDTRCLLGHRLLLLGDALEWRLVRLHVHELPRLGVPLDVVPTWRLRLRSSLYGTNSTLAKGSILGHQRVLDSTGRAGLPLYMVQVSNLETHYIVSLLSVNHNQNNRTD